MSIYVMNNPVQNYVWGSHTFIHDLIKSKSSSEEPIAELWMGAHNKASSTIYINNKQFNLYEKIKSDVINFMGETIINRFGSSLPFLLKVLAADEPLSIQVHPDKHSAEIGFERENALGIPLDANNRSYRDDNHKPELLCALTDFTAMCGFRPYEDITFYLTRYLSDGSISQVRTLINDCNPHTIKNYLQFILTCDRQKLVTIIDSVLKVIKETTPFNEMDNLLRTWISIFHEKYPYDSGVIAPLIFNIVKLKPFQALYLAPGVPHAYLKGAGIEVMANSDNVLRGGLTPKHIDTNELLERIDFSTITPEILYPQAYTDNIEYFITPATEFKLTKISLPVIKQIIIKRNESPAVVFCYHGSCTLTDNFNQLELHEGQSAFVTYDEESLSLRGQGIVFIAEVNC